MRLITTSKILFCASVFFGWQESVGLQVQYRDFVQTEDIAGVSAEIWHGRSVFSARLTSSFSESFSFPRQRMILGPREGSTAFNASSSKSMVSASLSPVLNTLICSPVYNMDWERSTDLPRSFRSFSKPAPSVCCLLLNPSQHPRPSSFMCPGVDWFIVYLKMIVSQTVWAIWECSLSERYCNYTLHRFLHGVAKQLWSRRNASCHSHWHKTYHNLKALTSDSIY